MEWLTDPTLWIGLLTLVLLEIVLGIDNLIFVAILAGKLPRHQQDRARIIGLGLALFFRIALLSSISWIASLRTPLIEIFDYGFSGRDLILLGGGLFLIFKSTVELHERLEGHAHKSQDMRSKVAVGFLNIIVQIIAIDVVFSLDSVITAVGMTDHLSIMITAVVIAVILMMVASKPLSEFVNKHPTLIILCLGFLLMIGFSLMAEGFKFHIPKGYLYAAIGFSVLVELFNQVGIAKRKKSLSTRQALRARTAEAVMRLMGAQSDFETEDLAAMASLQIPPHTFTAQERHMISGVFRLADLPARAIMTPLTKLHTISTGDDIEALKEKIRLSPFSKMVVLEENTPHKAAGFVHKKDILDALMNGKPSPIQAALQRPLVTQCKKSVLDILGHFKKDGIEVAFIQNEKDHFEGILTLSDIMGAIAGDLPQPVAT